MIGAKVLASVGPKQIGVLMSDIWSFLSWGA